MHEEEFLHESILSDVIDHPIDDEHYHDEDVETTLGTDDFDGFLDDPGDF